VPASVIFEPIYKNLLHNLDLGGPAMETVRVLLADDHQLFLEGLNARLEREPGIEVVGQAGNGREALELAHRTHPHVVLMDISMPELNGLEALARFRAELPQVRVLILTMHDNRQYILQLVQSGAAGYVLKEVSSRELVKAIEIVAQGGTYLCAAASQSLFSKFVDGQGPDGEVLTKREQMVLKLLAEGRSNKEIAEALSISVRTVETHRQHVKTKLNIQTAAGLTRYAIEHNLVQLA
jgi:two-component system nitrate/nitrite response regulator NarL